MIPIYARLLGAIFCILTLSVSACATRSSTFEVSVHEAWRLQQSGSAVIVDVRTAILPETARPPGAISIPYRMLREGTNDPTAFEQAVREAANGKEVLLICDRGVRSEEALLVLSQDISARNIIGGYDAWKGLIK